MTHKCRARNRTAIGSVLAPGASNRDITVYTNISQSFHESVIYKIISDFVSLVQDCSNPIVDVLELSQLCIRPSIYVSDYPFFDIDNLHICYMFIVYSFINFLIANIYHLPIQIPKGNTSVWPSSVLFCVSLVLIIPDQARAHFLPLARSKRGLCSANHRPGYWSNLPCDWPSTAWAYSEQETENGPCGHWQLV